MSRTDILTKKEDIECWIKEGLPKIEIARRLDCKIDTLNSYLKKLNISYKGQQNKKGQFKGGFKYTSIEEYLTKCTYIKSDDYKKKLIKFGIREAKCECCGNVVWNNKPIPLELHHIDGNHFNNELSNVQILCANCHAQQENNSGKNIKTHRSKDIKAKKAKKTASIKVPKYSEEEKCALINLGKQDSLGRVNAAILTEEEWLFRKELILNSGVDLTKFGWKTKVEQATGLTRRQVCLTIEHFAELFNNIIFKR